MKLHKLFSSFAVFMILFGLGGCKQVDDENIEEVHNEESTSLTTTESSESENGTSENIDDDSLGPAVLIDNIHKTSNYSITIEYTQYLSDPISYYDYYYGNYNMSSVEASCQIYSSYLVKFYYTDEAFLIEEYLYQTSGSQSDYSLIYSELFIEYEYYGLGFNDTFLDFVLLNGKWSYVGIYYGSWKDYYYESTLFMEGQNGYFSADSFSYYGSGTYKNNPCTAWDLNSSDGAALFLLLGTDALFSNPSSATISKYYNMTYLYDNLLEMVVSYGFYGWTYFTYPTNWDDEVYLCITDFYADVYDAGSTNLDSVIEQAYSVLG